MGVKILKFADERFAEEKREADEKYAEREQKAREESRRQGLEQGAELERRRLADSLRSRGFDESTIDEVLSFGREDSTGKGQAVQQA